MSNHSLPPKDPRLVALGLLTVVVLLAFLGAAVAQVGGAL